MNPTLILAKTSNCTAHSTFPNVLFVQKEPVYLTSIASPLSIACVRNTKIMQGR